jgi:hypothetical protein
MKGKQQNLGMLLSLETYHKYYVQRKKEDEYEKTVKLLKLMSDRSALNKP